MKTRRRLRLLIGTVRAIEDGRHVVVGTDGERIPVRFDGDVKPRIGADVIGRVVHGADGPVMTLARSVTEAILGGKSVIAPVGDPDITARMLARVLAGTKNATLRPGFGATIERSPATDDADVMWALRAIAPETERLGLALNVVDARALAAQPWDPESLQDSSLPADVPAQPEALDEMRRLMETGFRPGSHRMIDAISGMASVNFVIPYTPFGGGWSFARQISGMDRGCYPRDISSLSLGHVFTPSEARRLSCAREMARALASHIMQHPDSKGSPDAIDRWKTHRDICFADAYAVLTFLGSGGRIGAARLLGDLHQSSLHFRQIFGNGSISTDDMVQDTHRAVREATLYFMTPHKPHKNKLSTLQAAAMIAEYVAYPVERFEGPSVQLSASEAAAAAEIAAQVSVPEASLDAVERDLYRQHWTADFQQVLKHLEDNGNLPDGLKARLSTFAGLHVPFGMEDVLDREISRITGAGRSQTASDLLSDRGLFSSRLKQMVQPVEDEGFYLDPF